MSRIGNKAVEIPGSVKITRDGGMINCEGKEKLSIALPPLVDVEIGDKELNVKRLKETREAHAMQGLARSLINNMVIGLTQGFKKELTIVGVGYRAQVAGSKLTLHVGYSHPVEFEAPKGIKITVADNTKLTVEGADKQVVGEVAATIRRVRPPEPYKGKGIRYADEHVVIKEGKSVG